MSKSNDFSGACQTRFVCTVLPVVVAVEIQNSEQKPNLPYRTCEMHKEDSDLAKHM